MTMESPVTVAPNVPNFVLCDKVNVDVEPDVRLFIYLRGSQRSCQVFGIYLIFV